MVQTAGCAGWTALNWWGLHFSPKTWVTWPTYAITWPHLKFRPIFFWNSSEYGLHGDPYERSNHTTRFRSPLGACTEGMERLREPSRSKAQKEGSSRGGGGSSARDTGVLRTVHWHEPRMPDTRGPTRRQRVPSSSGLGNLGWMSTTIAMLIISVIAFRLLRLLLWSYQRPEQLLWSYQRPEQLLWSYQRPEQLHWSYQRRRVKLGLPVVALTASSKQEPLDRSTGWKPELPWKAQTWKSWTERLRSPKKKVFPKRLLGEDQIFVLSGSKERRKLTAGTWRCGFS